MAFCGNCGSEVEGQFCAKCGTLVSGPATAGTGTGTASPLYPNQTAVAQSGGLQENMACALCYAVMIVTGIVFLAMAPYNQNRLIRFHAWQSIFVWIGLVIMSIAMMVLTGIPILGWIVALVMWPVLMLGSLGLWLWLMYKAYSNERVVLPIVGPLAEKQAGPDLLR